MRLYALKGESVFAGSPLQKNSNIKNIRGYFFD
jgi:hypothetical protein